MEAVPITIIMGAPILSSMGFNFQFVENILVRILMLGILVYSIRFANADSGPLFSLLVFLAIVTLLIERNQYVVASLPNQKSASVIVGPKNLYPMKATEMQHVTVSEEYDMPQLEESQEFTDNIPDLKEGPSNHDSPDYYKSMGLL
jgi:hypothetical protein